MKPNITMIGMPSSGKSTVGVLLAKRLGFSFIDVDIVIQEKEGRLLKEIIADEGMDGFPSILVSADEGKEIDRQPRGSSCGEEVEQLGQHDISGYEHQCSQVSLHFGIVKRIKFYGRFHDMSLF